MRLSLSVKMHAAGFRLIEILANSPRAVKHQYTARRPAYDVWSEPELCAEQVVAVKEAGADYRDAHCDTGWRSARRCVGIVAPPPHHRSLCH